LAPPRDLHQRRTDAFARLETDIDVWVATADADGQPYLVPLSLDWDGTRIVVCAGRDSRTIVNLLRSKAARLGIGPTRDVVMLDVVVDETFAADEVPPLLADRYAQRAGWDPRRAPGQYVYVCLRPRRVQAWREANEIPGRTLMRDGDWLSPN
jgi:hypothetical protein